MVLKITAATNGVSDETGRSGPLNYVASENMLYPATEGRLGEGGLRVHGHYKHSKENRPLVSIITVVFNGSQYLEQTIQSVLNQDYNNIEFIIIDGASTDGTLEIIRKYDHVIDYWISEPDKGISDAFNKGVILSSGDYLNFQGAGDFLVSNDVLSRMMIGVDVAKDMIISSRVQRVREHNPDEIVWIAPRKFTPYFNKRSLLLKMSLPHQGLLTNKLMFERYGLFDLNVVYSMDYEHLLRAYKNFPHVVMKDIIFSAWREGGIGCDKISEILSEYSKIRKQNKVAPSFVISIIEVWSIFKYKIKIMLFGRY